MTTTQFLDLLKSSGEKELLFQYAAGKNIPNAYHITEIKNVHVDSVDCGGNEHSYDETIVQLWLSGNEMKDQAMAADKALKIFDIVNNKRALQGETEIFFEYGYAELATSVYRVSSIEEKGEQVIVHMEVPATVCKPRELMATSLPVAGNGGCSPGGGCC